MAIGIIIGHEPLDSGSVTLSSSLEMKDGPGRKKKIKNPEKNACIGKISRKRYETLLCTLHVEIPYTH